MSAHLSGLHAENQSVELNMIYSSISAWMQAETIPVLAFPCPGLQEVLDVSFLLRDDLIIHSLSL